MIQSQLIDLPTVCFANLSEKSHEIESVWAPCSGTEFYYKQEYFEMNTHPSKNE